MTTAYIDIMRRVPGVAERRCIEVEVSGTVIPAQPAQTDIDKPCPCPASDAEVDDLHVVGYRYEGFPGDVDALHIETLTRTIVYRWNGRLTAAETRRAEAAILEAS